MIREFGRLHARRVDAITLGAPDGLQAEILSYGGALRRLTFPAHGIRRELVLSLPSLDAYVSDVAYLGVLVGRVGNRIEGSVFELNGRRYALTANEGRNHLHGGALGFGKQLWRVLEVQSSTLVLGLHSPAGDEGYPGNLEVTAQFVVTADSLQLQFAARCDAGTPVNLTYHPYFNLSGFNLSGHHGSRRASQSIDEHWLRISASHYLPVRDSQLIPSGAIASVADTPFDFRIARSLRAPAIESHPQLGFAGGYDHCWVLDKDRDSDAELTSVDSGVKLRVHSTQPALQFYAGQGLSQQHPELGAALCLEPQGFPNAVNEPSFPSTMLQPGVVYSREIRFQLSCD